MFIVEYYRYGQKMAEQTESLDAALDFIHQQEDAGNIFATKVTDESGVVILDTKTIGEYPMARFEWVTGKGGARTNGHPRKKSNKI